MALDNSIGMADKQRISYVPLEAMDDAMRAEMDRCAREGTPRPESSAVRAHVPAAFWSFANSWRDLFHHGVCEHAIKELNKESVKNWDVLPAGTRIKLPARPIASVQ